MSDTKDERVLWIARAAGELATGLYFKSGWDEERTDMRVMTFNLRFENDRDGEHGWGYRRELVIDVIQRTRPWVLGTQEGTPGQLDYLRDHLPPYIMHTPPRPDDDTCQYPTLFYRQEKLRLLEGGELWLSKTPEVHRSKDWDSAFPRMMSYALFEDILVRRRVWVAVTHLDHMGACARVEQAKLVVQWMCKRSQPAPFIVMGDFNDCPGSDIHRLLTEDEQMLRDTWQSLGREEGEASMTHHDFSGRPCKFRMDWVLVSWDFLVRKGRIIRDNFAGRYPSDHFPYAVELEWAGLA